MVLLAPWGLWLVWELYLLARRAQPGPKVKTISMVARDRGAHLSGVIYLWAGMAAHWWLPWRHATVVGGVAFWVLAVVLVVWDVALWRHPVETWPPWVRAARMPIVWLIFGAAAGLLLFPQGM